MADFPDYIWQLLQALGGENVKRFMLADTLGILHPDEFTEYFKEVLDRFPNLVFDAHTHNDYDLAVANSSAAIKAGSPRAAHHSEWFR